MKSMRIRCSMLSICLSALLCVSCKIGDTLPQVSKPYLGEYICERAQLGELDLIENFTYVRLTLRTDETFLLEYCKKDGEIQREEGRYVYHYDTQELEFFSEHATSYKRKFPLKNGKLTITIGMGATAFIAEFAQK